jgi:hypothetical protein
MVGAEIRQRMPSPSLVGGTISAPQTPLSVRIGDDMMEGA